MTDRAANTDLRQRQALQRQRFEIVAMGVVTLAGGTATVTSNKVPSEGGIMLTRQEGANAGTPRVSARTFGLSFDITSSNVLDGGTVLWAIIK